MAAVYHAAMSSRLSLLALVAVALAIGVIWYARTDRIYPLASTPIDGLIAAEHRPDPPGPRPKIRRVTREQRQELIRQIQRATAIRTARSPSRAPIDVGRPPQPAHESMIPAVRKFNDRALEELGGTKVYLAECYEQHREVLPDELVVFTKVLVTTDPDIGAYLDAEALTDPDGKSLPAEFDSCIRDMLQTFALPPLPPTDDSQFLLAFQLSFSDHD
jgi:hypothetical protein